MAFFCYYSQGVGDIETKLFKPLEKYFMISVFSLISRQLDNVEGFWNFPFPLWTENTSFPEITKMKQKNSWLKFTLQPDMSEGPRSQTLSPNRSVALGKPETHKKQKVWWWEAPHLPWERGMNFPKRETAARGKVLLDVLVGSRREPCAAYNLGFKWEIQKCQSRLL